MNGTSNEVALTNMSACKQHAVTYGPGDTCACTAHAHLPGNLFLQAFHVVSGVLTRARYTADRRATDGMQLVLLESAHHLLDFPVVNK